MATEKKFQLPIIDLEKAKTNREEAAKDVVHGLENVGFLYIDNVKGIDSDKLMAACKWFFNLPVEEKHAVMRNFWKDDNRNVYRGYFPVKEGDPSRKEGFEFGRDVDINDPTIKKGNWFYEPSVWPIEDGTFPFKEFMRTCYEVLHNAGLDILRLAAIGLGIEENSFDELFENRPCSTFRIMHYPPWDGAPPSNARIEDGKILITPEHEDSNFLTLLNTFDYQGLEVLSSDGKWEAVESRPGSWIMNIGVTFSRMMSGRFKATRHRVLDIGVDRFSVPFFMSPTYDSDIGLNWLSKVTEDGHKHKVEKYGPWVLNRIKYEIKYFEYRVLPDIE